MYMFWWFEIGVGVFVDGLICWFGGKIVFFCLEDVLCKSDEELNGWKGLFLKWLVNEL